MKKNSYVSEIYIIYIVNSTQVYVYIFRDNITGKKRKRPKETEDGPKKEKRKVNKVLKEINELSVLFKFCKVIA